MDIQQNKFKDISNLDSVIDYAISAFTEIIPSYFYHPAHWKFTFGEGLDAWQSIFFGPVQAVNV